mmetsp:Transcript_74066/g.140931  ORF Transcript_74066/g.140931 Transcript_74066/m.140931 type:complete len:372 (+) Transcript_74066:73-1188(+)
MYRKTNNSPPKRALSSHWTPSGTQDAVAAVAEVTIAKANAEINIQKDRADKAEHQALEAAQETMHWRKQCALAEARVDSAERALDDAEDRATAATERAMHAETRAAVAEAQVAALKEKLIQTIREADAAVLRAKKSEQRADSAERRAIRAESLAKCTETRFSSVAKHAEKAEDLALNRVKTAEKQLATVHDKAEARIRAAHDLSHRSMKTASMAITECQRQSRAGSRQLSLASSRMTSPGSSICPTPTSSGLFPRRRARSASPKGGERSSLYGVGFNGIKEDKEPLDTKYIPLSPRQMMRRLPRQPKLDETQEGNSEPVSPRSMVRHLRKQFKDAGIEEHSNETDEWSANPMMHNPMVDVINEEAACSVSK